MTEDEAQSWIAAHFGNAAHQRLAIFLDRVAAENENQNLISPGTVPLIWSRHAADSAQLLRLAPESWANWLDIGTGGGFPGMVIALLAPERHVVMAEPRRKRADFLNHLVGQFGLENARVDGRKVEEVVTNADVISARAVAPVQNLLQAARHCSMPGTTWLLPRGRSAETELVASSYLRSWMFHVEHSLTDPQSLILVLEGAKR